MNIDIVNDLIPQNMVKAFWEKQDSTIPTIGSDVHYCKLALHIFRKIEDMVAFRRRTPYIYELKHFIEDAGWNYYEWRKCPDAWDSTAKLINMMAETDSMIKLALKRAKISMRAYDGNPWSVEMKFIYC